MRLKTIELHDFYFTYYHNTQNPIYDHSDKVELAQAIEKLYILTSIYEEAQKCLRNMGL